MLVVDGVWNVDCVRGLETGPVADQALGKGWDDGMTVGRGRGTRHQTPDLFQIHKIRVKILHLSRPHKW